MHSGSKPQMKAWGQLQGREKCSLSIRQKTDAHKYQNGRWCRNENFLYCCEVTLSNTYRKGRVTPNALFFNVRDRWSSAVTYRCSNFIPQPPGTHRKVIWVGLSAEINVVTKKTHPPPAGIKSGSSTPYNGHCTVWANHILKTHSTELAT